MKRPQRRQFFHLATGAAALPAVSRIARAETHPTRPVRIFVGAPPGGAHDIIARLIAPWLADRLGQPFLIDNRPGQNTNIGAQLVVKAAPDGYTLLLLGVSHAINVGYYGKLAIDLGRDIIPVAALSRTPLVMVVHPSVPAKTDVQEAARAVGLQIQILNAMTSREIDAAFATFERDRPDALFVAPDPFCFSRRVQFAALAAYHRIPVAYATRDYLRPGAPRNTNRFRCVADWGSVVRHCHSRLRRDQWGSS
jgi:hypothetical protein